LGAVEGALPAAATATAAAQGASALGGLGGFGGSGLFGTPIQAHNTADSRAGRKVWVYCPLENEWWGATVCMVSTGLLVFTGMLAPLACSRRTALVTAKLTATVAGDRC
jgi:hypothetical protein